MAGGYNRALVERLLPAVFDPDSAYGMKNETRADADMPKGHVDKKKGSPFLAHLADMHTAWKWARRGGLPLDEQKAILLRYGLDWTQEDIAVAIDTHQRRVSRLCERGVGRIAAHLNGVKYVDGYDEELTEEEAA
ncbi:DNA binding protein [Streptomyces phage Yosif]|uniref:DNA binding protein n=1 Tax=Streptomyces phage Yosif TaxID=2201421 RepID=A0A2Z4QCB6_9CAUD|nr:sigma factor [Streptomyces phage Yosif]AWY07612.1 DNA binding protein [Streptomyces phage Yosif]